LGTGAEIQFVDYGEAVSVGEARVTLFPAGHILGSAQVRVEHRGEVWVVSGDYKVAPDPTCDAFEPVRCHTFITESTFGLPIYRWPSQDSVFRQIEDWWRGNQEIGRTSLLLAYSLGKAQRMLAGIDSSIGEIYTHGAVEKLVDDYRVSGIAMPATLGVATAPKSAKWKHSLVVAPPSVLGSTWVRRFGRISAGFASGWMRLRGRRRQPAVDRGFVLSDHADWDGLVGAIDGTGAERVWVTHGRGEPLARWLRQRGQDAQTLETQFGDAAEEEVETEPSADQDDSTVAPEGQA